MGFSCSLHAVKPEWLEARKKYLTASDFYSLWPKTKTGRDRSVSDLDYLKVYVDKIQDLEPNACISKGWAARGHILEPYAVDEFNRAEVVPTSLYHWDDAIVVDEDKNVGYSPDCLNIPQPDVLVEVPFGTIDPRIVCEVKSYKASKHLEVALAKKMFVEERIQIAVAMYVSPSIDLGCLVLFNPEVPSLPLSWDSWSRDELSEELEIVDGIVRRWTELRDESSIMNSQDQPHIKWTIDAILKDYNEKIDSVIEGMNDIDSGNEFS